MTPERLAEIERLHSHAGENEDDYDECHKHRGELLSYVRQLRGALYDERRLNHRAAYDEAEAKLKVAQDAHLKGWAQAGSAQHERDALLAAVADLFGTLPKCEEKHKGAAPCPLPATNHGKDDGSLWCDAHGDSETEDLPYAEPLRWIHARLEQRELNAPRGKVETDTAMLRSLRTFLAKNEDVELRARGLEENELRNFRSPLIGLVDMMLGHIDALVERSRELIDALPICPWCRNAPVSVDEPCAGEKRCDFCTCAAGKDLPYAAELRKLQELVGRST